MVDVASAAYLEYLFLCRRHIHDQRGPTYDQDCASTGASTMLSVVLMRVDIPGDSLDPRSH